MLPEHLPNIALAGPTASGKTAGALALAADDPAPALEGAS